MFSKELVGGIHNHLLVLLAVLVDRFHRSCSFLGTSLGNLCNIVESLNKSLVNSYLRNFSFIRGLNNLFEIIVKSLSTNGASKGLSSNLVFSFLTK